MTRPLRINLAGGWYHITARGNNRQAIYEDNRDHRHFLDLLGEMIERYGVRGSGISLTQHNLVAGRGVGRGRLCGVE